MHLADFVDQHIRVGGIAGAEPGMVGAVIGQQMPFARDPRQHLGITARLAAHHEEGGADVHLAQSVQNLAGVQVGAIVKGERDGVGAAQARCEDGAFLEKRELLRLGGFHQLGAVGRDRRRQNQQRTQAQGNLPHVRRQPIPASQFTLRTASRNRLARYC